MLQIVRELLLKWVTQAKIILETLNIIREKLSIEKVSYDVEIKKIFLNGTSNAFQIPILSVRQDVVSNLMEVLTENVQCIYDFLAFALKENKSGI